MALGWHFVIKLNGNGLVNNVPRDVWGGQFFPLKLRTSSPSCFQFQSRSSAVSHGLWDLRWATGRSTPPQTFRESRACLVLPGTNPMSDGARGTFTMSSPLLHLGKLRARKGKTLIQGWLAEPGLGPRSSDLKSRLLLITQSNLLEQLLSSWVLTLFSLAEAVTRMSPNKTGNKLQGKKAQVLKCNY